jgi:hypothetical protein
MTGVILGILRKVAEPMTTRDVAIQMLIQPALDSDDVELLRVFRGRVACALRIQRDKGVVRSWWAERHLAR